VAFSANDLELMAAQASEDLITVTSELAGKVTDSGNETIGGIKTFTLSPIVPTPTTNFQAATKKYVDDTVASGGGGGAPLNSPAFTGTPTAPTAGAGTNSTQLATTAYVVAAINAVLNGAPGALDTLKELADAINDDASFAATVTAALAGKVPTTRQVNGHALSADIVLARADVGLGSVDNTADVNKPVSTLQQASIDEAFAVGVWA
jgi:hypothetical protein